MREKKKTIFEISKNSPGRDKYEKVVNYFNYDERFLIDCFPHSILSPKAQQERLLDVYPSLCAQLSDMLRDISESDLMTGYKAIKEYCEKVGAKKVTRTEFSYIAPYIAEKVLSDCYTLCNGIAAFASYLGYIDIKNEKYEELKLELQNFKKKYQEKFKDILER